MNGRTLHRDVTYHKQTVKGSKRIHHTRSSTASPQLHHGPGGPRRTAGRSPHQSKYNNPHTARPKPGTPPVGAPAQARPVLNSTKGLVDPGAQQSGLHTNQSAQIPSRRAQNPAPPLPAPLCLRRYACADMPAPQYLRRCACAAAPAPLCLRRCTCAAVPAPLCLRRCACAAVPAPLCPRRCACAAVPAPLCLRRCHKCGTGQSKSSFLAAYWGRWTPIFQTYNYVSMRGGGGARPGGAIGVIFGRMIDG